MALLAVTAGPGPLSFPAVAGTASATEKVFQSDRYVPRGDRIHSTGPSGYLHSQEGRSGYLWAHVLDRADLSAAGTTVTLPGTEGTPHLGIAGRWLVVARSVPSSPGDMVDLSGERLMAVPLAGGDAVTLLRHANTSVTPTPDGGLRVAGGTDAGHWAVRKVTGTEAAVPTLTEVTAVPPVAARIERLQEDRGRRRHHRRRQGGHRVPRHLRHRVAQHRQRQGVVRAPHEDRHGVAGVQGRVLRAARLATAAG